MLRCVVVWFGSWGLGFFCCAGVVVVCCVLCCFMSVCTTNTHIHDTSTEATAALAPCLDRLAEVYKSLNPQANNNPDAVCQAAVALLKNMWPLMEATINKWRENDRIMERLTRIWKYAIKATRTHFSPLLGPMVTVLANAYKQTPHSSFLYVASICVDTFGDNEAYHKLLSEIYTYFSSKTFAILKNGQQQAFIDNPDIVEDYFEMMSRFVSKCPGIVFNAGSGGGSGSGAAAAGGGGSGAAAGGGGSGNAAAAGDKNNNNNNSSLAIITAAVTCSLSGLTLQHSDALSAVCSFIATFLGAANPKSTRGNAKRKDGVKPTAVMTQIVAAFLKTHGQTVVSHCVAGVTGGLPRARYS